MKTAHFAVAAALFAAGGAHGQRIDPAPDPVLETRLPLPMQHLPSYPGIYAGNEGLPPANPQSPDYFRPDLKLYTGIAFSPNFGIDLTFTNPDYREGVHFRGFGPRLAESIALGAKGYNLDLTARAAVPVTDEVSAFGTPGVSAGVRKYPGTSTTGFAPMGSVGATFKLNSRQTATAEIPFGAGVQRIGGKRGGIGATVKLGF